MSCSKRYFDNGNRLRMDECALSARQAENASIQQRALGNFRAAGCSAEQRSVEAFMACNPNLRVRDVGVDPCLIDNDSSMRTSELINPRQRNQLPARQFVAVPNLSRGVCAPALEAQLRQGNDTDLTDAVCDKYSSADFARLIRVGAIGGAGCEGRLPNVVGPVPVNSKHVMRAVDAACDASRSCRANRLVVVNTPPAATQLPQ